MWSAAVSGVMVCSCGRTVGCFGGQRSCLQDGIPRVAGLVFRLCEKLLFCMLTLCGRKAEAFTLRNSIWDRAVTLLAVCSMPDCLGRCPNVNCMQQCWQLPRGVWVPLPSDRTGMLWHVLQLFDSFALQQNHVTGLLWYVSHI